MGEAAGRPMAGSLGRKTVVSVLSQAIMGSYNPPLGFFQSPGQVPVRVTVSMDGLCQRFQLCVNIFPQG